ncbi:MAG TPA: thioredoxin family protein [Polyangiaceae bacterium]|nr:thioredoxin family protein [Polyangiaceae bacterium]
MSAFRRCSRAVVVALATTLPACQSGASPGHTAGPAPSAATDRRRPLFVKAPTGGDRIAPYVANQLARGREGHYGVLVYVGATWCEPCQRFHRAVEAGEFDVLLAGVHLLEFDLDASRDALHDAGYGSELIPLFAFPNDDGTGSDRRIEGSIKGPTAIDQNLLPRLQKLLADQAARR